MSRLAKRDFLEALPVRAEALVHRYGDRFRGRRVLDLGAHTGDLTAAILEHAGSVTALEANPAGVEALRGRFGDRVTVVDGDLHRTLFALEPGAFDVVFCAGFLYHTAHPFLVLEGIARLGPERILIDTLNADVPGFSMKIVETESLNTFNYRYNEDPDCGFSLVLGNGLITAALANLGYAPEAWIDKSLAATEAESGDAYLTQWVASLSAWFTREGSEEQGVERDADA